MLEEEQEVRGFIGIVNHVFELDERFVFLNDLDHSSVRLFIS